MGRMIVVIGIALCISLLQICWATNEAANELVDSILKDGNRYLKKEIEVDEIVGEDFPIGFNVTVYRRRVTISASEVTRTKDAVLALTTPTDGFLVAYLTAGEVTVYLKYMSVGTPWGNFKCRGEVVYDGEYVLQTNINKAADCDHCPANLRGRDYKPKLKKFTCDGFRGKLFSFIVKTLDNGEWLRRIELYFSGPAFHEAVVEPFQEAARRKSCKCYA